MKRKKDPGEIFETRIHINREKLLCATPIPRDSIEQERQQRPNEKTSEAQGWKNEKRHKKSVLGVDRKKRTSRK